MQRGAINRWGGGYTRYDSVGVIRSNTLGHCIGMLLWVFTQSAGTQGCFRRFLSLLRGLYTQGSLWMHRRAINRWGWELSAIHKIIVWECLCESLHRVLVHKGCFIRFLSLLNNWGFQSNFRNCGLVAAVFCAWLWTWLIQGKVVVCGVVRGLYTQGSLWMHRRAINRWGVGVVRGLYTQGSLWIHRWAINRWGWEL